MKENRFDFGLLIVDEDNACINLKVFIPKTKINQINSELIQLIKDQMTETFKKYDLIDD